MGHTTAEVLAAASVPSNERTKAQREAVASDPDRQSVKNASAAADLAQRQGVK